MPRNPNSNSGKSLTIHFTDSEEKSVKAFKEIHGRNTELQIHSTIMEAVNRFLAKHNYPPGNSQTCLFGETKKKCGKCPREVKHLTLVEYISGSQEWLCASCLRLQQKRSVVKRELAKK